jgi:hypothetical protein
MLGECSSRVPSLAFPNISCVQIKTKWLPIMNVHAGTEDKIHDMTDSFYVELERVYDKFPKYHIKILLGNFNAKVVREERKFTRNQ